MAVSSWPRRSATGSRGRGTPLSATGTPMPPPRSMPSASAGSSSTSRSNSDPNPPVDGGTRMGQVTPRPDMKGIIFNELIEFVDRELPGAAVRLGNVAYSPLANYPEEELLALVARASEAAGVPASEILRRFGSQ